MSSNNILHQPLVHVHFLREIKSLALQQYTLILLRPLEGFRHLEGVFRLGLAILEGLVLLRWREMG